MVKNPPANAGDMSSISGPGRSYPPTGQLSLCAIATEARVPRAVLCSKRSPCSEDSVHCS